jgi:hypothetical protein
MSLALFALDHGTESVAASGGPLVPFSVVETDGQRSLTRFAGDLEASQQRARAEIRAAAGVTRAAVAWDGYLTTDVGRTDAVFVEASEDGDPESVVLAQRYVVSGRLRKKVEVVGNAALVKRGPPLF